MLRILTGEIIYSQNIRIGLKVFTDTNKFPYGFKKSGDFSILEASLLSTFGDTLFNLEFGSLQAESVEEERFVLAARGLKSPETLIERVWLKYVKLSRTRKNFYTMHSSRIYGIETSEDSDFDDIDTGIEA